VRLARTSLAAASANLVWIGLAQAEMIKITEAIYGCLCEPPANCDAIKYVAAACDGKASCSVLVGLNLCAGLDPLPGEAKGLLVRFQCDGVRSSGEVRASDGQQLRVNCP
jgi:hypothetical protein